MVNLNVFIETYKFSKEKCIQMSTNKPSTGIVILNTLNPSAGHKLQTKIFNFFKKVQSRNFHSHIWIHHAKCIQVSTNKPSIGLVVLEIRKNCHIYIALV